MFLSVDVFASWCFQSKSWFFRSWCFKSRCFGSRTNGASILFYNCNIITSVQWNGHSHSLMHTGGGGGTSCTPLKDSKKLDHKNAIKHKNWGPPPRFNFLATPSTPLKINWKWLWCYFRCRQRWRRGRSGGRSSSSDATDLITAGGSGGFFHKRRSKGKKTAKTVLTLKNKKKNKERRKNDAKFIWSTESKISKS